MAFNSKDVSDRKHTGITFRGKEVQLIQTRGRVPSGLVRLGMERGVLTQAKTIEAATVYAVTGDVEKTAELTKVPSRHLRKLIKTDDFKEIIKEIREENAEKFTAGFSEIVEKAQKELVDRIENGDTVLSKGKQVQVPMKGKDLAAIASQHFDRLQVIQGKPTAISGKMDVATQLDKLAKAFEKIANKKPKVIDVADAEVVSEPVNETT